MAAPLPTENTPGVATKIEPHLWLGDLLVSNDIAFLEREKIKHVVRMFDPRSGLLIDRAETVYLNRSPHLVYTYVKLGIKETRFSIEDSASSAKRMSDEVLGPALDAIRAGIQAGENVLVHCNAGLSRSPTVVAAWMLSQSSAKAASAGRSPQWCVEAVVACIRQVRHVQPNEGFQRVLRDFATRQIRETFQPASGSLSRLRP